MSRIVRAVLIVRTLFCFVNIKPFATSLMILCSATASAESEYIDYESLEFIYAGVVRQSCDNEKYRNYMQLDTTACYEQGLETIRVCGRQLREAMSPFARDIPFGKRDREAQLEAQFVLLYCLQSSSAFDPALSHYVPSKDKPVSRQAHVDDMESLLTFTNSLPRVDIAKAFDVAKRSEYWSMHIQSDTVFVRLSSDDMKLDRTLSPEVERDLKHSLEHLGAVELKKLGSLSYLNFSGGLTIDGHEVELFVYDQPQQGISPCTDDIDFSNGGACLVTGVHFPNAVLVWL